MKTIMLVLLCAMPLGLRASAVTLSNTNTIIINDSVNPPTVATPYPSSIVVTGLTGQVTTMLEG